MASKVQIYSPSNSAALQYTLAFIFRDFYSVSWELVTDPALLHKGVAFIDYSDEQISGGIQIVPHGSFEKLDFPFKEALNEGTWNELPVFFKSNGEIPFDIFAAVFFSLSRYEEYHISERDEHGRFKADHSILSKLKMLHRPVVDEWLLELGKVLELKMENFRPVKRKFEWINTFDIDVAFAYTNRPLIRVLGGTGKNVLRADFNPVLERAKVLFGLSADPFDTYEFQKQIALKYECKTLYFFLSGGKTTYDNALDLNHKGMRSLIHKAGEYAEIGLHPSYNAGLDREMLSQEKGNLEEIAGRKIRSSRQHFLRLKIPETYHTLEDVGIKSDYTMGYAERFGFRSGTATPHRFFNLKTGETTGVKIYPLHLMDGTLRDYMKLNPDEAISAQRELIRNVKRVKGTFVSLWHNDTLRRDGKWRDVYGEMAKELGTE